MHLDKGKRAISELLGSLIMIGITLIAGAAVFGFVSGQAVQAVNAVGNSANEKDSIIYAQITSADSAIVYVYNYGAVYSKCTGSCTPPCTGPCLVVQGISVIALSPSTQGSLSCSSSPGIPTSILQYSKPQLFTLSNCKDGTGSGFIRGTAYAFVVVGQFGSNTQLTAGAP